MMGEEYLAGKKKEIASSSFLLLKILRGEKKKRKKNEREREREKKKKKLQL